MKMKKTGIVFHLFMDYSDSEKQFQGLNVPFESCLW